MATGDRTDRGKDGGADVRKETYKGHEIIYPRDERWKKIFIDGRPVHWGVAGGRYYLDVYAYDRGKTLDETVKRYIDYREKAAGRKPRGEVK
jgi:hypothetical protein